MNTKKKSKLSKSGSSSQIPAISEPPAEELPQHAREHVVEFKGYRGPLPPAEEFQGYNNVLEGAANRILVLAENQSSHRQNLEKGEQNMRGGAIKRGQWMGFIIAFGAMGMGFYLSITGSEVFGFWLILSTIGSLLAVFVINRFKRNGNNG